jgi:hypothetical protein
MNQASKVMRIPTALVPMIERIVACYRSELEEQHRTLGNRQRQEKSLVEQRLAQQLAESLNFVDSEVAA